MPEILGNTAVAMANAFFIRGELLVLTISIGIEPRSICR
jgi:hypothetical protein